jgi:hypothetical protein
MYKEETIDERLDYDFLNKSRDYGLVCSSVLLKFNAL